eukprot:s1027_g5.t1
MQEDDDEQAPEAPLIAFAPQHENHVMEEIAWMSGDELDSEPWTAATFGLGLVHLGRRDLLFDPTNLMELLDIILEVTIALIVEVEYQGGRDPTSKCTLVLEQAADEHLVRTEPYAARLFSEASEREILAQLNLHQLCPPFTLRECHVRIGIITMERDQFYDFADGVLCRPWFGSVPSQVGEAAQRVDMWSSSFYKFTPCMNKDGSCDS